MRKINSTSNLSSKRFAKYNNCNFRPPAMTNPSISSKTKISHLSTFLNKKGSSTHPKKSNTNTSDSSSKYLLLWT